MTSLNNSYVVDLKEGNLHKCFHKKIQNETRGDLVSTYFFGTKKKGEYYIET